MEKLKEIWLKVKEALKSLWEKHKLLIILMIPLILLVKFREVLMKWIAWTAKRDINKANEKDQNLLAKQNEANEAADKLRDLANKLSSDPVDENWNKK